MTKTIQREILIPQPREQVWRAITDSATLAEWMFPTTSSRASAITSRSGCRRTRRWVSTG